MLSRIAPFGHSGVIWQNPRSRPMPDVAKLQNFRKEAVLLTPDGIWCGATVAYHCRFVIGRPKDREMGSP